MPFQLSKRQIKAADRVGGIELMLPWPEELPEPGDLDDDSERDATEAENKWAQAHVRAACQRHGLVPVRVQVVRTHGPLPNGGGAQQTRIAVIIIGRRWVHATGGRAPRTLWYTPSATGRSSNDSD